MICACWRVMTRPLLVSCVPSLCPGHWSVAVHASPVTPSPVLLASCTMLLAWAPVRARGGVAPWCVVTGVCMVAWCCETASHLHSLDVHRSQTYTGHDTTDPTYSFIYTLYTVRACISVDAYRSRLLQLTELLQLLSQRPPRRQLDAISLKRCLQARCERPPR